MEWTLELRERLYAARKYVYVASLQWNEVNKSLKLKAPVYMDDRPAVLTLRGTCRNTYSFALHYANTLLVRRWDFSQHTHLGETVSRGQGHKHPHPDSYDEATTYVVHDIPIDDLDAALWAFLEECNIEARSDGAGYQQRLGLLGA